MTCECSRCGKEITIHQWLNNTLGNYESCRFSFCNECYPIAREEMGR